MIAGSAEQRASPAKPMPLWGTKPLKAGPNPHIRVERPHPAPRGEKLGSVGEDFVVSKLNFHKGFGRKAYTFQNAPGEGLELDWGAGRDSWPWIARESWLHRGCWRSGGMKAEKAGSPPHFSRTMPKSKPLREAALIR